MGQCFQHHIDADAHDEVRNLRVIWQKRWRNVATFAVSRELDRR